MISLSAFILAFCGLTYEFVFAQSLSVLLGNSVTQYSLTIGIFLAALGFGALYAQADENSLSRLLRLQLRLAIFAPSAYFSLWIVSLYLPHALLKLASYSAVAAIGYLTGSEIPLLMQMGGEGLRMRILAADYFGMLTASILFPIYLLPHLGVFSSILVAALFNCSVLLFLGKGTKERTWSFAVIGALCALLFYQPGIREWLSDQFINSAV
jgi:spermidine synthase